MLRDEGRPSPALMRKLALPVLGERWPGKRRPAGLLPTSVVPLDLDAVRATLEAMLQACRAASLAPVDDRRPLELDQSTVNRLSRMNAIQQEAMAHAAEPQRRIQI